MPLTDGIPIVTIERVGQKYKFGANFAIHLKLICYQVNNWVYKQKVKSYSFEAENLHWKQIKRLSVDPLLLRS